MIGLCRIVYLQMSDKQSPHKDKVCILQSIVTHLVRYQTLVDEERLRRTCKTLRACSRLVSREQFRTYLVRDYQRRREQSKLEKCGDSELYMRVDVWCFFHCGNSINCRLCWAPNADREIQVPAGKYESIGGECEFLEHTMIYHVCKGCWENPFQRIIFADLIRGWKPCLECLTVNCHGRKCQAHHNLNLGVHCESCFGQDHPTIYNGDFTPSYEIEKEKIQAREAITIWCNGYGCNHQARDGRGLHCESCFGPNEDLTDTDDADA